MIPDPKAFRSPGQFIQSLLIHRGWTQRTLSIVLDVGDATVNRIVSNKQPIDGELDDFAARIESLELKSAH